MRLRDVGWRIGLTLLGAAISVSVLWWTQTPDPTRLLQRLWPGGSAGSASAPRDAVGGSSPLSKTVAAAFPAIVIVRPEGADAAATAQRFVDALTDAGLYPQFDTVLIGPDPGTAPCRVASAPLLQASNGRSARRTQRRMLYVIGPCALQHAIAAAQYAQRIAALRVGVVEEDRGTPGSVPLIFTDIDEMDARLLVPSAQRVGYTVRGVIAAPALATQLRWAHRYLPQASPVRIGYWRDVAASTDGTPAPSPAPKSKMAAVPDSPTRIAMQRPTPEQRLRALRDAAQGLASNDERLGAVPQEMDERAVGDRVDEEGGAIEIVAATGPPAEAIARWRHAGVRLLYADAHTPPDVLQAAVNADIGTFCDADTASMIAVPESCLLRVTPLRQAAPSMAAYLASQILLSPRTAVPAGGKAPLWQALPQGPLRLDGRLARRMQQMPPLSLLDDVRISR
ncbi:hypothetical protein [Robbsia sp. KACC 23696]|uniref:hypothetical protein n=1 Tax=Robbsia sp. KACC 23696 TaxID=3149231 RepID=UPI00325ABF56